MSYYQLAYFHLATVVPAFLIGTYLLLNRKGTDSHRKYGRIYMALMVITATTTFFMRAEVGPKLFEHFGFIHLFSVLVFVAVPMALYAARNGNVKLHVANMVGLYVGGLLIAGAFAFMPGRLLHNWLFT